MRNLENLGDQIQMPEMSEEDKAEIELEKLLANPEHAFLRQIPQNINAIDSAESYVDMLKIARSLILRRAEATFRFEPLAHVEGVEIVGASAENMLAFIENLRIKRQLVGEGGDAFVVMAENDLLDYPPEICYKISKEEQVKRGRNSTAVEANIQDEVFRLTGEYEGKIAVPRPYYIAEVGSSKIIAMQKLPAHSIDDIQHGRGKLPDWFDIDEFCNELKSYLDMLHEHNLYHRDMHVGNVMIRQTKEEPEDGKWGYVIDFGLSGHSPKDMDPYKRESLGYTFTYNDDYAIIRAARVALEGVRKRKMVE